MKKDECLNAGYSFKTGPLAPVGNKAIINSTNSFSGKLCIIDSSMSHIDMLMAKALSLLIHNASANTHAGRVLHPEGCSIKPCKRER